MIDYLKYIKSVRAKGRYYFTLQEALDELQVSLKALRNGLYKLRQKGEIISPADNLYVILPPEYQSVGCLPPEELIPILMKYWDLNYYVCLLTAALYHGASHQKPQVFQVMVNKPKHSVVYGKVKIEFIYKKNFENIAVQDRVVKSGYLKIATPETTAMDLLIYPHRAGGLNHIATVLNELLEVIDNKKLIELASSSPEKAWIQRLGYILEKIDPIESKKCDELVIALKNYLTEKLHNFILLASGLPKKGMPVNYDWMVIENTIIEADE